MPSSPARPRYPNQAAPPGPAGQGAPQRSSRAWVWLLILVLAGAAAYYFWSKKSRGGRQRAKRQGPRRRASAQFPWSQRRPFAATSRSIFGPRSVTPIYTVEVKSRVDGEMMTIYFKEATWFIKATL